MAFFRDLTPYEYARAEPQPNILNVGWLSDEHAFSQAVPDGRFVEILRRLVARPTNLFRGRHTCELCPPPPWKPTASGIPVPDPRPETTGNGEIRVPGDNGMIFVAPVLILHYVTEHHYAPPREFVEAVLRSE
jgi:hypothetical protein